MSCKSCEERRRIIKERAIKIREQLREQAAKTKVKIEKTLNIK